MVYLVSFIIGFLVVAWLIAFFTVLTKEFKQPTNKIVWMLLLIFLAPLGAVLFMLFGFQQLDSHSKKNLEEIEVAKYFHLVTLNEDDAFNLINILKNIPKEKINDQLTKIVNKKPNERRLANDIKDGYVALRMLTDEVANAIRSLENNELFPHPIRYDYNGKEQYFIYYLVDKKMELVQSS